MTARFTTYALLAAALLASAGAGCSDDTAAPPRPELPGGVGPAPLRRMSDAQYLNALRDLFPGQAPALPPLPHDAASAGFDNAAEAQQPSDVRISRYETIANLNCAGRDRRRRRGRDAGWLHRLVDADAGRRVLREVHRRDGQSALPAPSRRGRA